MSECLIWKKRTYKWKTINLSFARSNRFKNRSFYNFFSIFKHSFDKINDLSSLCEKFAAKERKIRKWNLSKMGQRLKRGIFIKHQIRYLGGNFGIFSSFSITEIKAQLRGYFKLSNEVNLLCRINAHTRIAHFRSTFSFNFNLKHGTNHKRVRENICALPTDSCWIDDTHKYACMHLDFKCIQRQTCSAIITWYSYKRFNYTMETE